MIYGQDAYFLGFPYGLKSEYEDFNNNFPVPFVKKAIVSSLDTDKDCNRQIIFLDGHNNPGFSGGPVVFTELRKNVYKVVSVISGVPLQQRANLSTRQTSPTRVQVQHWNYYFIWD